MDPNQNPSDQQKAVVDKFMSFCSDPGAMQRAMQFFELFTRSEAAPDQTTAPSLSAEHISSAATSTQSESFQPSAIPATIDSLSQETDDNVSMTTDDGGLTHKSVSAESSAPPHNTEDDTSAYGTRSTEIVPDALINPGGNDDEEQNYDDEIDSQADQQVDPMQIASANYSPHESDSENDVQVISSNRSASSPKDASVGQDFSLSPDRARDSITSVSPAAPPLRNSRSHLTDQVHTALDTRRGINQRFSTSFSNEISAAYQQVVAGSAATENTSPTANLSSSCRVLDDSTADAASSQTTGRKSASALSVVSPNVLASRGAAPYLRNPVRAVSLTNDDVRASAQPLGTSRRRLFHALGPHSPTTPTITTESSRAASLLSTRLSSAGNTSNVSHQVSNFTSPRSSTIDDANPNVETSTTARTYARELAGNAIDALAVRRSAPVTFASNRSGESPSHDVPFESFAWNRDGIFRIVECSVDEFEKEKALPIRDGYINYDRPKNDCPRWKINAPSVVILNLSLPSRTFTLINKSVSNPDHFAIFISTIWDKIMAGPKNFTWESLMRKLCNFFPDSFGAGVTDYKQLKAKDAIRYAQQHGSSVLFLSDACGLAIPSTLGYDKLPLEVKRRILQVPGKNIDFRSFRNRIFASECRLTNITEAQFYGIVCNVISVGLRDYIKFTRDPSDNKSILCQARFVDLYFLAVTKGHDLINETVLTWKLGSDEITEHFCTSAEIGANAYWLDRQLWKYRPQNQFHSSVSLLNTYMVQQKHKFMIRGTPLLNLEKSRQRYNMRPMTHASNSVCRVNHFIDPRAMLITGDD